MRFVKKDWCENMISIEYLRYIRSKKLILILIMHFGIVLLNFVLANVFALSTSHFLLLALYNSMVQFSFFIFPIVIISTFRDDYNLGHDLFFYQNGISKTEFFFSKLLVLWFFVVGIALGIFFIFGVSMQINFESVIKSTLILGLCLTTITFIGTIISLLAKTTISGVLIMYGVLLIGDVLNLIPLFQGILLQPDKNSFSTGYVTQLLTNGSPDNRFLNIDLYSNFLIVILVNMAVLTILFIIIRLINRRQG